MKRILLSFFLLFCLFSFKNLIAQSSNFSFTQTCFGNQTTLVASSSLPDTSITSWQWDLDGNGTYEKTGKTVISLFTQASSIPVKLKITSHFGAADSVTKNVIIDPLPQVNFFSSNLCQGKMATYIGQSSISSGNITQYKWDFNNDGIDDAFGDTATYTCGTAASYVTKLTCVSDKGCVSFAQKITTVYANPTAIFSNTPYCVNANAVFNNNSIVNNLDFYLWRFVDGNQGTTSGNAMHNYAVSGTYSVTLIASTLNGCRDSVSHPITINSLPVVSITPGSSTTFCVGNNVILDAGNSFSSYSWNNGSSAPSVSVSSSGNYSVTVTDANGCSNSASISVDVNPLPVVSITENGSTVLHAGSNVQLIANGATNYLWNTNATTNNITVDSIGTYIVTGTDLNNCQAKDSITITFENSDSVSVTSNILTPNGDGINDVLKIFNITAYDNCSLTIYNMWHEKVFSTNHYDNNWDGKLNGSGNIVPAGAYYYIIKCDDKPLQKGNINILK